MLCVEWGWALALMAVQSEPPAVRESGLESGARVVLAATKGGDAKLHLTLALPVGFANDATPPGSGLAGLMAAYATAAPPEAKPEAESPWTAEMLPSVTLFSAELAPDAVPAELTRLLGRLRADGVEEESLQAVMKSRAVLSPAAADRLRELAYPLTAAGMAPGGRVDAMKALTKERLQQFLTARVGSEGSVLVITAPTSGPSPAQLEIEATKALSTLARAQGTAPVSPAEPPIERRRAVAGVASDGAGFVGLRFERDPDPSGDGDAIAIAWLESVTQRSVTMVEVSEQGTLLGFHGESAAATAALAQQLDAATSALATAHPWSEAVARSVVDRIDRELAAVVGDRRRLAAELAKVTVAGGDPAEWWRRGERARRLAPAELQATLENRVGPHNVLVVSPGAAAASGGGP